MPTKELQIAKRTVLLDARPDRPDLRDRIYQPPLKSLEAQYPPQDVIDTYLPAYSAAGMVLDQGAEGACTGFGLAAAINYLLFAHAVLRKVKPERVSTRMLYHLARKYDEWPGEDYDGSSCRGAMKGWFHHGVCSETLWPYRKKGKVAFVRPSEGWDADAAQRPLGAYYRIQADSIADMQAAISEVGAIYVSSSVHAGWDVATRKSLPLPTIAWKPRTKLDGGHAYALVGYDSAGFIVQNSWGPDWGYLGFALLLYDDWLSNGDDAWVAVLGAPVRARAPAILLSSSRTVPKNAPHLAKGLANGATAEIVGQPLRPDAWDTATAVKHSLVLGNQGLPDHVTIDDQNGAEAAERVCFDHPNDWLTAQGAGTKRIAIYVHGGLNDLGDGLARVKGMGSWFERNGIYPIFVVWQSGFFDSIANIVCDVVDKFLAGAEPRKRGLVDFISDTRDRLIETTAIPAARPVWSEMKENAIAASSDRGGGMALLAGALARLAKAHAGLEVHLVGHSAGAVALGAFLARLRSNKLKARTVSLYAPACTVGFALDTYLPAAKAGVIDPAQVVIDLLSNANELDDKVGGVYGKSLLYLVSRALEPIHKTPLLGLEAVWNPKLDPEDIFAKDKKATVNPDVAKWRAQWQATAAQPQIVVVKDVKDSVKPPSTIAAAHGCFDNWVDCVERTLVRILALPSVTKLPVRVTSLKLF